MPLSQYWACLDYYKILQATGFIFKVASDRPCHLWCRWTTNSPWKHEIPVLRRGLRIRGDTYFCFTAYHDLEQTEAGDTLTHTFVLDNWTPCERRWFYFHGTINGDASPSTSPIFTRHFGILIRECDGPSMWYCRVNKNQIEYLYFKVPFLCEIEDLALYLGRHGNPGIIWVSIHEILDTGYPDPDPITSATRGTTDLPEDALYKYVTIQFERHPLAEDKWYAIRVACHAVPPVEVIWKGWTSDICPDTYWVLYRKDLDRWFFTPNNELYHIMRGVVP